MAIKSVVWDIRGVLLNESGELPRRNLSKKFGFNPEKFKEFSIRNLDKSLRGQFRGDRFFREMANEMMLKDFDARDIANEWIAERKKTTKVNAPVFKVLDKLKSNYVLISFTNSTALNDVVRNFLGVYKNFDYNLISHEGGFVKPEEKSFKVLSRVLKNKGIHPDEVVFVDDKKENLIKAREFGLNTIHFKDKIQLTKDLKKFGVNV